MMISYIVSHLRIGGEDMVGEYIFGKLTDLGIDKVGGWLNKNKAQEILLKCFCDTYENYREIICVDDKVILAVDSYKIKPNLRPEKIIENLKDVFKKIILTDDPYQFKRIELEIVYSYLKEANNELLKLCNLDEDIHFVQDEVLENRSVIEKNHKEISKGIQDIYSRLKNDMHPILYFVQELNNSRMYCYIILKVSTEVDEYLFERIEEESGIGAEYEQYMEDGLPHIEINFLEAICQRDLRIYLEVLDKLFLEDGIGIYGILTH